MPTFAETEKLVKERIKGFRKGTDDVPNYTHSLNVRELLKKHGFNRTVQMAGLLHDIVEDGDTTFQELRDLGYPHRVVHLVNIVSHDTGIPCITNTEKLERWKDMIKGLEIYNDKDARAIKLADICDNVQSCHTMPNKEKLETFLRVKCPYFLKKGKQIFGLSSLYLEFRSHYVGQILKGFELSSLSDIIQEDRRGKYIDIEGAVFRNFVGQNKYSGFGYMFFPDSGHTGFYIGEYLRGNLSGYGQLWWGNGDRYNGDWKNGKKNGIGRIYLAESEETYYGFWKNDKPDGYGWWLFANGDEYEGDRKDGQMTGEGVLTCADGTQYQGEFMDGEKHGKGTIIYPDGSSLTSERGGRVHDQLNGKFIYKDINDEITTRYFRNGEEYFKS